MSNLQNSNLYEQLNEAMEEMKKSNEELRAMLSKAFDQIITARKNYLNIQESGKELEEFIEEFKDYAKKNSSINM